MKLSYRQLFERSKVKLWQNLLLQNINNPSTTRSLNNSVTINSFKLQAIKNGAGHIYRRKIFNLNRSFIDALRNSGPAPLPIVVSRNYCFPSRIRGPPLTEQTATVAKPCVSISLRSFVTFPTGNISQGTKSSSVITRIDPKLPPASEPAQQKPVEIKISKSPKIRITIKKDAEIQNSSAEKLPSKSHPFECNICSKSFRFKSQLLSHSTTHSSDRPFKCYHLNCTKSYKLIQHLNRHQQLVHGEILKPRKIQETNFELEKISNLQDLVTPYPLPPTTVLEANSSEYTRSHRNNFILFSFVKLLSLISVGLLVDLYKFLLKVIKKL